MEEFKKCKSYTEMAKWLGYNYYNGRIKKEIEQYCLENNLNAETIIANNSKKLIYFYNLLRINYVIINHCTLL